MWSVGKLVYVECGEACICGVWESLYMWIKVLIIPAILLNMALNTITITG
jgi:hypothetical protein